MFRLVQFIQLKEKTNQYIFKRKTEKKKAPCQVEGRKKARAAEERSRSYTLAFLSDWNFSLLFFLLVLFADCRFPSACNGRDGLQKVE